jgi:hypothetical protein
MGIALVTQGWYELDCRAPSSFCSKVLNIDAENICNTQKKREAKCRNTQHQGRRTIRTKSVHKIGTVHAKFTVEIRHLS